MFDPEKTSFRNLLEFFFQIHDPTTRNRQGNDVGMNPKYSAIATPGIYAVYLADRRASGKVRAFTEFLAKQFGAPPHWNRNPSGGKQVNGVRSVGLGNRNCKFASYVANFPPEAWSSEPGRKCGMTLSARKRRPAW
jgi:Peptide methionine sulfoxide reductase